MASAGSSQDLPYRIGSRGKTGKTAFRPEDYHVGWVCALSIEMAAAQAMLDQVHAPLQNEYDTNSYILGSISDHNIVVACLPAGHYGTNNAAIVASNMRRTFPKIRNALMVGIGGGVPEMADVRLGDIVVSLEVIQYDLGKTITGGQFQPTAIPIRPPQNLLTAVSKLRAHHVVEPTQVPSIYFEMLTRHPNMFHYSRPNCEDHLFSASCSHSPGAHSCDDCPSEEIVERETRDHAEPVIHYGRIASGNQVLKDGLARSQLAQKLGVLCFEMEAAGMMDQFPCLVIRGICDYSDSHKNKQWQQYAAATAAAYAKELLVITLAGQQDHCAAQNRQHVLRKTLGFERMDARRDEVTAAHKTTCDWMLEHPTYLSWQDPKHFPAHHGLLWISGKPGAGKSTMMKYLYTTACSEAKAMDNTAVISFFFNARGVELEKTVLGMLQSLLLQVLEVFPDVRDALDVVSLEKISRGREKISRVDELQAFLSDTLIRLGSRGLVCLIDALDECDEEEAQDTVDFFESLGGLAAEKCLNLRICSSSRHYPYLHISQGLRLTIEEQPGHEADIIKYVQNKLLLGKTELARDVIAEVLSKASGVFLWIVLAVDILNKEFKRGRIFAVKKRLTELPVKLSDMFANIISRDGEHMEDFLLCVQWLLFSNRPLRPKEFYLAIVSGLDPSPENLGPWNSDNVTEDDVKRFVLSASKGLAEIVGRETEVVQFVHDSVRDFLIKGRGVHAIWPDKQTDFKSASHDRLKQCCQSYLGVNFELLFKQDLGVFDNLSEWDRWKTLLKLLPFLEYANSILFHANKAARDIPQDVFIETFDIAACGKLGELEFQYTNRQIPSPPKQSLLLWSVVGRRRHLVKRILEYELRNCTMSGNYTKSGEFTEATSAAISNKDIDMVKTLLATQQVKINWELEAGGSLLINAIEQHCTEIVELLINAGADIRQGVSGGHTPLMHAALSGQVDMIKLLIATGKANVNDRDDEGKTALMQAVYSFWNNNAYEVVEELLKVEGIDLTAMDSLGRTALSLACLSGDEDVEALIRAAAQRSTTVHNSHLNSPSQIDYAPSTNNS